MKTYIQIVAEVEFTAENFHSSDALTVKSFTEVRKKYVCEKNSVLPKAKSF